MVGRGADVVVVARDVDVVVVGRGVDFVVMGRGADVVVGGSFEVVDCELVVEDVWLDDVLDRVVVVVARAEQYPSAPQMVNDPQHCLPQHVFDLSHVPPGQHCSFSGLVQVVAPPSVQQVSALPHVQTLPFPSQHCEVSGV